MAKHSFVRARTADGPTLINLDNVAAIVVDENGSFGVKSRVTVHLVSGEALDFPEQYGKDLLETLRALDDAGTLAGGPDPVEPGRGVR